MKRAASSRTAWIVAVLLAHDRVRENRPSRQFEQGPGRSPARLRAGRIDRPQRGRTPDARRQLGSLRLAARAARSRSPKRPPRSGRRGAGSSTSSAPGSGSAPSRTAFPPFPPRRFRTRRIEFEFDPSPDHARHHVPRRGGRARRCPRTRARAPTTTATAPSTRTGSTATTTMATAPSTRTSPRSPTRCSRCQYRDTSRTATQLYPAAQPAEPARAAGELPVGGGPLRRLRRRRVLHHQHRQPTCSRTSTSASSPTATSASATPTTTSRTTHRPRSHR